MNNQDFTVQTRFTLLDLLSKGVDRIRNRLSELSKSGEDVRKSFNRMAAAGSIATGAFIATRSMERGLKSAITLAGALEDELTGVRAEIMSAHKPASVLAADMDAIKRTAFQIQAWTPFDEGQIVALEKQLLKAGATVSQVVGRKGAAAAAAGLAVYKELDPVEAGRMLLAIGKPFKLQGNQFMELGDSLSRASKSAATIQDIAEAARYAAAPMANFGISYKKMLQLVGPLANMGLPGEMIGTGLRMFLLRAAKIKEFRDAKGNLLEIDQILAKLQKRMKGMGTGQRAAFISKMFDIRAVSVVETLMDQDFAANKQQWDEQISLQEKLTERMKDFNPQLMTLKSTYRSVIADLFTSALPPMTRVLEGLNEITTKAGEAEQKNGNIGKTVSYLGLGGVAAGSAVTAGATMAALYYARKTWRGVGGLRGILGGVSSTAAGIAEGKAVEAVAGVNPVFVTNWPANMGNGSSVVTAAAAGTLASRILPAAVKLAMLGMKGVGVAAVGYATYEVFSKLNELANNPFGKLGELFYEFSHSQFPELKNNINIRIDPEGRVTTDTDNMRSNTEVKAKRGSFVNYGG